MYKRMHVYINLLPNFEPLNVNFFKRNNFQNITVCGRLIHVGDLQYFSPFCISVHKYSCKAVVSVYTDTQWPLIF